MKTITSPDGWRFSFTVSDLARFLGKSPVTIRGWERQGWITIPRDSGGDRKLNASQIREIAQLALQRKRRITSERYEMICTTMALIEQIEKANDKN